MEMITDTLSALYVLSGVLANLAYVPTIRDLWALKPAANLHSYAIWTATSALVLLYAIFVNGDHLFIFLSSINFAACSAVVLLEARRIRRPFIQQYQRGQS